MGLFDKIKAPVFLKESSELEQQLAALKELRDSAEGELAEQIDEEIKKIEAGLYGENSIHYELETSHIPMLILHDLLLEYHGLTAQIDYMIFTRKHIYLIECKNLYGNIEINAKGDFIRTFYNGKTTRKEGIYSPITQNRRHLELIKELRSSTKNFLAKALFEKSFYNTYRSVVVIANPKTVLYDRYAKKDIRAQVIKYDQLSDYIRKTDASEELSLTEKEMQDLAQYFLSLHKENKTDYTAKYRNLLELEKITGADQNSSAQSDGGKEKSSDNSSVLLCPKCGAPMVKRVSNKGMYAGQEFYGCSRFPACRSIIQIKEAHHL